MSEEQLTAAIEAFEQGDKRTARGILEAVIEKDQRNAEAWYLMYQVVDSPEEKQICLENVTVLEPDNAEARAELDRLKGGGVGDSFFDVDDPFAAVAEEFDAALSGDDAAFFEDAEAFDAAPAGGAGVLARMASNTRLMILLIVLLGASSACMLLLALTMLT